MTIIPWPQAAPPRARVLIADDDTRVREMTATDLTGEGYSVSTVQNGREMLDAVATFQPDVVVVDMVMPELSGADVVIALRRASVTIPVILMSGYGVPGGEAYFAVLAKPFELYRLAEIVAAAVEHPRTTTT